MNFQRLLSPWKFFVAPTPTTPPGMKLSEGIRRGALSLPESHIEYNHCAIGTAYYGKHKRLLDASWECGAKEVRTRVAESFGVSYWLVRKIDLMHQNGKSRMEIANYLQSINQ